MNKQIRITDKLQSKIIIRHLIDRPVGRAKMHSSLEQKVWGSNLGPASSDTVLPTARHLCDISSKEAVLPGRNDTEMGLANLLHALAYYCEYNERFDLTFNRVLETFAVC